MLLKFIYSLRMIEALITSKTRIKLLLKFFLNSNSQSYLRGLENDFNESTNAIRMELNKLEEAGLLIATNKGNKKLFKANTNHPLFSDINSIITKYVGIDQIIKRIINKIGNLEKVYLTGDLAVGVDSNQIDLLFVGNNIDENYLFRLVKKAEAFISRKIFFQICNNEEFYENFNANKEKFLLIWQR